MRRCIPFHRLLLNPFNRFRSAEQEPPRRRSLPAFQREHRAVLLAHPTVDRPSVDDPDADCWTAAPCWRSINKSISSCTFLLTGHPCANCKTTQKKSGFSTKNHRSSMPPDSAFTYGLINSIRSNGKLWCGAPTNSPPQPSHQIRRVDDTSGRRVLSTSGNGTLRQFTACNGASAAEGRPSVARLTSLRQPVTQSGHHQPKSNRSTAGYSSVDQGRSPRRRAEMFFEESQSPLPR